MKEGTITIDFVRHANSCANLAYDQGRGIRGRWYQYMEADPHLSAAGIEGCKNFAKSTKAASPDVLIASPLTRAIETAALMWPRKRRIVVAPHLREWGLGPSNRALQPAAVQDTWIGAQWPAVPSRISRAASDADLAAAPGDLRAFVLWLRRWLVAAGKGTGDVHVVVVTHSYVMKQAWRLRTLPANNSIWRCQWTRDAWNALAAPRDITWPGLTCVYAGERGLKEAEARAAAARSPQCRWFGALGGSAGFKAKPSQKK